jgi:hypothetical protein
MKKVKEVGGWESGASVLSLHPDHIELSFYFLPIFFNPAGPIQRQYLYLFLLLKERYPDQSIRKNGLLP